MPAPLSFAHSLPVWGNLCLESESFALELTGNWGCAVWLDGIPLAVCRPRCQFGNGCGPGSLAANCDRFLQQLQRQDWASRWLNNPAFWPVHVFGLEPFPWNDSEPNTAVCSQATAPCLGAEILSNIVKCHLPFPGYSQTSPWKYKKLHQPEKGLKFHFSMWMLVKFDSAGLKRSGCF